MYEEDFGNYSHASALLLIISMNLHVKFVIIVILSLVTT